MGGTKRSLALYLRGHHAAGAAAVGQVRRQAAACRDGDLGLLLVRLSKEIAEDRGHLAHVMTKLGVKPARLRSLVARIFGWLARWFIRAHAPGRPQALLIGLESLSLGIEGKASLWRTLREVAVGEPRIGDVDFDALLARAEDQRRQLEPHRLEVALQANANAYSNGSRVTAKGTPHQPDPSEIPAPSSLAGAQAASRQPKPAPTGVLSRSTVVAGRPDEGQSAAPASAAAPASRSLGKPTPASSEQTAVLAAVKGEPAEKDAETDETDEAGRQPVTSPSDAGESSGSDEPTDAGESPGSDEPAAESPSADESKAELGTEASAQGSAGEEPDADRAEDLAVAAGTEPRTDAENSIGTGTAASAGTEVSTDKASGERDTDHSTGTDVDASPDAEGNADKAGAETDTEAGDAAEAEAAELSEEEQRRAAELAIEAEAQKLLAEVEREVEAKLKAEAEPPETKSSRRGRGKAKRPPKTQPEAPVLVEAQETVAMSAVEPANPEPKDEVTAPVAAAAKKLAARKPAAAAKKESGSVYVAKAAKPKKAVAKQVFVPRPKVGIDDEPPAPPARPARRKPRRVEPQRVVIDPKKLSTLKFEAIKGDKPPAE
jgi:hypothetical protein